MDRRTLLARFGAVLGSASLGGCLSQYDEVAGGVDDTTTEADDEEETTTSQRETTQTTTTTTQRPTLADSSFELTDAGCGQPTNEASVSFGDDGSVGVTGTIPGSSACYIAELADARYDPEAGTLEVTVATVEREGTDTCSQCITEIDYEATFSFEGGLPAQVRVVHRAMDESQTVATAESE